MRLRCVAVLLSAAAAMPALPAHATAAAPPLGDAELAAALRSHIQELAARDAFSGAVLLAKGDQVLLREAVGLASREAKTPNTPETRFNLGSINKAFTRLAIEMLAHDGKLRLDDTLDKYVPEYPVEKGRTITLAHLLEHRAGTGDFFGPRFQEYDKRRLKALRDWLPLIADHPLGFTPGTQQRYSNAGYLLLGLVIEKVAGQSYFDYVREHVFAPAGMKDTDAYSIAESGERLATGYTRRDGDGLRDNRGSLPYRGSSAGGGYSTVDDLLRFATAMRKGTLGPRADGMGVAGGAPGVNAALEMTGDYTLVVLANQDPPAAADVAAKVRGWRGIADDNEGGPGRRRVRVRAGEEKPDRTILPGPSVDVPMLHAGHLPAVHVMLNGQGPFLFVIDTGAAGLLRVDAALAERLQLPKVGEMRDGDPSGRNVHTAPVVGVASAAIGAARFEGLAGSVRDLPARLPGEKVDGVLGFGLFADCVLTLDAPGKLVRFSEHALPAENGRDVLGFRTDHGIPSLAIRVAGRAMEAHVDTGAMGGVSLPESEAPHLTFVSPPKVVGRGRTVSNEFEIKAAPLDGDVTIGALVFPGPTLELQPLFPIANLGARVLHGLVLSFDQKNRRVRLTRP